MTDEEEFRDIPGFPGYQVSSLGTVRSMKKAKNVRILKTWWRGNKTKYMVVELYRDGMSHEIKVSFIVSAVFPGDPLGYRPHPSSEIVDTPSATGHTPSVIGHKNAL